MTKKYALQIFEKPKPKKHSIVRYSEKESNIQINEEEKNPGDFISSLPSIILEFAMLSLYRIVDKFKYIYIKKIFV